MGTFSKLFLTHKYPGECDGRKMVRSAQDRGGFPGKTPAFAASIPYKRRKGQQNFSYGGIFGPEGGKREMYVKSLGGGGGGGFFTHPHLTQDMLLTRGLHTAYRTAAERPFYQRLMRFLKNGNRRLHKRKGGKVFQKGENGLGQGVLHIFHRVFHSRGSRRNPRYVNRGKNTLCNMERGGTGERKWKNIYFFAYFLGKESLCPEGRRKRSRGRGIFI